MPWQGRDLPGGGSLGRCSGLGLGSVPLQPVPSHLGSSVLLCFSTQQQCWLLQISSLQLRDPVLMVKARLAVHSPRGTAASCASGSWAEMLLVTEFLLLQCLGEVVRTPCCPNRSVARDELS